MRSMQRGPLPYRSGTGETTGEAHAEYRAKDVFGDFDDLAEHLVQQPFIKPINVDRSADKDGVFLGDA